MDPAAQLSPTPNVVSDQTLSQPTPRFKRRRWLWIILCLLCIVTGIVLIPFIPSGSARIIITPKTGDLAKATTWPVMISVNSKEPVNAVDVVITFPPDALYVTEVSTEDTAFDLVLFEPKIDNTAGTIRFVQSNPTSYSGMNGQIGQITFKAIEGKKVNIGVGAARVVVADGTARNIYRSPNRTSIASWLWEKRGK